MRKYDLVRKIIVLVFVLIFAGNSLISQADSYTYNSYGKTVSVPSLYSPVKKYTGNDLGYGSLNSPTDLCIDEKGNIYILDKGNNRVIISDNSFSNVRELKSFINDGNQLTLLNPTGIYVKNPDEIYIADTDNERIILSDSAGNINRVFTKPDISQFKNNLFLPTSILVDGYGNVYAKCTGIYQGLVMFNEKGEYQCFFGSETVKATAAIQLQYWWKSLMNDEQKSKISRYVPTEIKGVDIDKQGYIYTVASSQSTKGVKNTMDNIRRLNTLGNDILVNKMNKSAWKSFENDARSLNFIDISVDENNFITLLDNRKGLIVLFDNQLQLLDILGGYGEEIGKYQLPSAVECFNNKMYVLDSSNGSLTVYEQTKYGKQLQEALLLYKKGYYSETVEAWNEIIKKNTNCEIAYEGLGNAYLSLKEYDKAVECFEIARNSEGYNEAFKYIRKQYIKKYFTPVLCLCLIIVFTVLIIRKRKKGKRNVKI